VDQSITMVFPGLAGTALQRGWQSARRVLPSAYSQHIGRFHLDMSLCLLARQESADAIWIVTADSSPQLSRDWLLSSALVAKRSSLPAIGLAFRSLSQARLWRDQNLEEIMPQDMVDRTKKEEQFIATAFTRHYFLPVALGLGATNLLHKVASLLHASYFESHGLQGLRDVLQSVVSITTDLGTEVGVHTYKAHDIVKLLPAWMQTAPLLGPDGEEAVPAANALQPPELLPRCVGIPGCLRLLHNMCVELHSKLEYFATYWEGLKQFELLLNLMLENT